MMKGCRVVAAAVALGCAWIAPCCGAGSLSAVLACRALTDSDMRLACFDRETATLDSKAATGSALAPIPAPVPPDPKKQFGLPEKTVASQEVAAGSRAADAAKIEAKVVSYAVNASGRGVFSLDNAQVWRQVESTSDMLIKSGDGVVISRGLLGSYWLSTTSGRGCKVTRLR